MSAVEVAPLGATGNPTNVPAKPKQKKPQAKKRPNVEGKPPAQLLNELYKGITDTYDNDAKMYKCTLTVEGQTFQAIGTSKKNAKHEACIVALTALRPDLASHYSRNSFGIENNDIPSKTRKVDVTENCDSLKKLLSKVSLEANKKYKLETDEKPAAEDATKKTVTAVLTFEEGGKTYTHSAEGANAATTKVIRQALKEIFSVSESDILKVITKSQLHKLHTMQSFSALNMVCALSFYSVGSVEFEDVMDGKTPNYICTITLKDSDGMEAPVKGPQCKSKGQAKERTAATILAQVFQVQQGSTGSVAIEKKEEKKSWTSSVANPVAQLFEMGSKQKPALRPEFTDLGEEIIEKVKNYKCKCIMNGLEFEGSGKSKKDAKNEAANLALQAIYNIDVSPKKVGGAQGQSTEGFSAAAETICSYVKAQYEQMCQFYGMNPSSDFACFLLLNENNEKRLISIGSSPQSITPLGLVAESNGKAIIHHESVVYARRGAVRYFISQLALAERGQESCFEVSAGGKFILKKSLRLAIVTSNPIDITLSAPESTSKKLAVYGQCNLLEPASENEEPRVHCVADKIFKWCHLGVQGSLLSNRINPIIPASILTMTRCPLPDTSYSHSFTARICPPPFPIIVSAANIQIDEAPSPAHIWNRADSTLEKIDHHTGMTTEGVESTCSKYQLYKAFIDGTQAFHRGISYQQAKHTATGYVSYKGLFINELIKTGLGKWNGLRGYGDRFLI